MIIIRTRSGNNLLVLHTFHSLPAINQNGLNQRGTNIISVSSIGTLAKGVPPLLKILPHQRRISAHDGSRHAGPVGEHGTFAIVAFSRVTGSRLGGEDFVARCEYFGFGPSVGCGAAGGEVREVGWAKHLGVEVLTGGLGRADCDNIFGRAGTGNSFHNINACRCPSGIPRGNDNQKIIVLVGIFIKSIFQISVLINIRPPTGRMNLCPGVSTRIHQILNFIFRN
mmetsp:Transcript_16065/g.19986  ORF Transcript_16065/g.19986 Transcript_16065/m.19986 type:complete len:225 (+) Transcript_16065:1094-1768(+)